MRFAYVTELNLPSRYASAVQIMKMSHALAGLGFDFEFITNMSLGNWRRFDFAQLATQYDFSRRFKVVPLPLHRLSTSPRRLPKRLFFLLAALRCKLRSVDFVHTRSFAMPLVSIPMGIPTIFETHGWPGDAPDQVACRNLAQHPLLLGVAVPSEIQGREYRRLGMPDEKVLVLPNGFDADRFAQLPAKAEARRQLSLDAQRVLAVYAGHLYEDKGAPLLLDIAALLPDIDFLLVGGHDQTVAEFKKRAADRGLTNLRLTGHQPHGALLSYLAAADISLLPYSGRFFQNTYVTPVKLNESMAAGKAIVASDLPALTAHLRHGENAMIAKPDDAASFAEQITLLAKTPELSERLGQQAYRDAQGLDWNSRAEALRRFASRRLDLLVRGRT